MTRVRWEPRARIDLLEAGEWYEERTPGAGGRFVEEVRSAIERVRMKPSAGLPFEGEFRRILVRRFPYNVIFRLTPGEIWIVTIVHQSRGTNAWLDSKNG